MNVKVYGFEWAVGRDTTLPDFLNYLKSENGVEKDNEVLAVTERGGYWAGVLVSIRNARAYFQYQKQGKGYRITVQRLATGASIVDINFFLLNPDTGAGLYQHYFRSAPLSAFGHLCATRYISFKTIYGLKGRLTQSILMKPDSIEQYTQQLALVKRVEVEFTTSIYSERQFRPVAEKATRVIHKAVFDQRWRKDPRPIKKAIVDFFMNEREHISNAKVTGLDGNGLEVNYKLLNDPDVFLEYNYDDFINDDTLDTNDLVATIMNSVNVGRLLELAKQPGVKQLLTAKRK